MQDRGFPNVEHAEAWQTVHLRGGILGKSNINEVVPKNFGTVSKYKRRTHEKDISAQ
jgi:hypothetical protein